ncbi:hypothetical protein BB560_001099 [Smittium megazygosporum]|uniref:21S rRNA pseudouridine(2819) synthase n=1 Tax=Smittium megazygosporum TaxID=133381 RepID=A0A2T9ZIJ5_9FUNG|nr:hypothetical protein BB560_001099 [Smittium megazygosporum]
MLLFPRTFRSSPCIYFTRRFPICIRSYYTVDEQTANRRADYIVSQWLKIPTATAQKLIRKKLVWGLNEKGNPVLFKNADKLSLDSRVEIKESVKEKIEESKPFTSNNLDVKSNSTKELSSDIFWKLSSSIPIVYEDEAIYVFSKPSGISTQGGSKVSFSIDDYIKLWGKPIPTEGKISVPLTKNDINSIEKMSVVDKEDKEPSSIRDAITSYRTKFVGKVSNDIISLLELYPHTGRKHQLRVHCSSVLNCPILGDFKYSSNASKLLDVKGNRKIVDGKPKEIIISTPFPDYWQKIFKAIGFDSSSYKP